MAAVLSFALLVVITPMAQADDSKAEVKLKVEVISPVSVTTSSAWPVGYRMALLHGRLTDMGTDSTVTVYFEWGKTTAYGSKTRVRKMTHTGHFSAVIYGLTPGTTYHFRAAVEDGSTSYGADQKFKTRRHWWKWGWR